MHIRNWLFVCGLVLGLGAVAITAAANAAQAQPPELMDEERAMYELVQDSISVESFAAVPWHIKKTLAAVATKAASGHFDGKLIPAYCFDGNVPLDVIEYLNRAYYGGGEKFNEIGGDRWFTTATGGSGTNQGDPVVLTFSFVPDGTLIPGDATIIDTETSNPMADANSNLFAFFNGIYGSPAGWQPIFQQVFDNWSALTGITYVFEPNDDGAAFPDSGVSSGTPGAIGVRGDIRIAGIRIDGQNGGNILAFNFFPDSGDMVIDTANPLFFSNLNNGSRALRNVVAHEHGHGLGMAHTCPVNATKLMEPFITSAFDGVQQDDRLSGQRTYGDPNESDGNETVGTATDLGSVDNATVDELTVSIDGTTDIDVFQFTTVQNADITITLTPIGTTYLTDTQQPEGDCNNGVNFNALTVANLNVEIIDADGSTILETADASGAGATETISSLNLATPDTYFVRVFQDSAVDNVQGYNLSVTAVTAGPPVPVTNFVADVTEGTAPLTVQFTDISTESPFDWEWDFENDGTPDSTDQNPTHVYTNPGVYTVKLTATNANGSDDEIKTDYITVNLLETDIQVQGSLWAEVGDSVSFTALPASAIGYQWYHNDSPLGGETDQTLTVDPIDFGDAGFYYCEVTTAVKGVANTPTRELVVFAAGALPIGLAATGALAGMLATLAILLVWRRRMTA